MFTFTDKEKELLEEGMRIKAIVSVRSRTNLGLREAVTLVDMEAPGFLRARIKELKEKNKRLKESQK